MTPAYPVLDARDLAFQLYDVLGVESLTRLPRFAQHSRETFDAAIDTARRIAEAQFRPHHRRADLEEPRIENGAVRLVPEVAEAIRAFADAGFFAAHHDEDRGGMQLPWVVAQAAQTWFHAANVATYAYCFLTIAAANLLDRFGSADQKRRFMLPLVEGRFLGTMCLSEPQAGSSLADITTRAEPLGDGRYRISGSKMWISAGAHGLSETIVHLVLARVAGAPPGVKGISLFVVPRDRVDAEGRVGPPNDVALLGLNHKMGYRGAVNTVLRFGEAGDCVGELVGPLHGGLGCMFQMMNEARIVVGMSAAALAAAGYQASLDYARNRPQGRSADAKDPASPPVMIVAHADVRRLLLEQKVFAEGAMALGLHCAWLVDRQHWAEEPQEREEAGRLLDILTPIMKAWSSVYGLRANDNAIQVLGGYGYTREFPVEQFYRDNRLNPIHEGTNGIQAIDLLGRKVTMAEGALLALLLRRIRDDIAGSALAEASALERAVAAIEATTGRLGAARAARGASAFLADASLYLQALGRVVIGWMWLRQGDAAAARLAHGEDAFLRGKLQACRFYFRRELPQLEPELRLLDAFDDSALAMQDAWF